jgi:hypothetical protein
MSRNRVVEVIAISVCAAAITAVIAAPVLRSPSDRVFGMAIVGRHHDPFTVMQQFGRPLAVGVYSQPITDAAGTLLARATGTVAAYNWLVLLTFPLSAGAAYALARYLTLSPAGAAVAAMAYAFAPFHIAHAAYHPHIAQTQWLPLYLLALWRCLDKGSPGAVAFLAVATLTVTLSNFYGGLIAAVITPVAAAAYWLVLCRGVPGSARRFGVTVGSLLLLACGGLAYAWYAANGVFRGPAFAFPRPNLFLYSAKWWSYLIPPVAHPLLGTAVRRLWAVNGVDVGLLEQQVSLGWALIALALVAVAGWLQRGRLTACSRVPVLASVAVAALLCSLSPERTIAGVRFVRPSALLYDMVPMFRSYARFGVIVQLMTALLAGIGVDRLRRVGTTSARVICIALVALVAGEYAVWPAAMSRDVLPTRAHRWVMQQPERLRVLDCTPPDQESVSVEWLTDYRVTLLGHQISDCRDARLPQVLAENGYTHLLVRRDSADGDWFASHPVPDGLSVAAQFDDAQMLAVRR